MSSEGAGKAEAEQVVLNPECSPAAEQVALNPECRLAAVAEDKEDESSHAEGIEISKLIASNRSGILGRYHLMGLWIAMMIVGYIYSLEQNTTYLFLAYATSDFNYHSSLTTVTTVQTLVMAILKTPCAKFSDKYGRAQVYLFAVLMYAIGYTIAALSKNVKLFCLGLIIYAVGNTTLQCIQQIVCSDLTTLRWRQLAQSLISVGFIINCFVSSEIAAGIYKRSSWRWGYGMFIVLVPLATTPVIGILWWAQVRAKRMLDEQKDQTRRGETERALEQGLPPPEEAPPRQRHTVKGAVDFCSEVDVIGLILLGLASSLILLPLTDVHRFAGGWQDWRVILMLTLGCAFLPVFVAYEYYLAKHPVVPFTLLKERNVVGECVLEFFDFISFYLTFSYLYSFITTVTDWDFNLVGYYSYIQSIGLTVSAVVSGLAVLLLKRFKIIVVAGTVIRLVGVGLMIPLRGVNSTAAELIITQVLQGFGGGLNNCSSVGAQGSVGFKNMAVVLVFILLMSQLGGAVGNAVAGAIWTNIFPPRLKAHLEPLGLTQAEIDSIYNGVMDIRSYQLNDPIRVAVGQAMTECMRKLNWAALGVGIIPLLSALFIFKDIPMTDVMNVVDDEKFLKDQALEASPELATARTETSLAHTSAAQ